MARYPFSVSVRARLDRLGKPQYQLAAALGYSPSYLSMYLSGKLRNPDLRPRISDQLSRWEADARNAPCTSRSRR